MSIHLYDEITICKIAQMFIVGFVHFCESRRSDKKGINHHTESENGKTA